MKPLQNTVELFIFHIQIDLKYGAATVHDILEDGRNKYENYHEVRFNIVFRFSQV